MLELVESLRGDSGRLGSAGYFDRQGRRQFHDLQFPHDWASVSDGGGTKTESFLPLPPELKKRVEWKRPHEIGNLGFLPFPCGYLGILQVIHVLARLETSEVVTEDAGYLPFPSVSA